MTKTADVLRRHGFEKESRLLAGRQSRPSSISLYYVVQWSLLMTSTDWRCPYLIGHCIPNQKLFVFRCPLGICCVQCPMSEASDLWPILCQLRHSRCQPPLIHSPLMDAGSYHRSAAKGSAIVLEVIFCVGLRECVGNLTELVHGHYGSLTLTSIHCKD